MWDYLLHLWATPPATLALACPPGAPGQTTNPAGIFDERTIRAAYGLVSGESLLIVLACVFGCYMLTRASTGPRFTRQWLAWWGASVVLTGAVVWAQLHFAPGTTAEVQTCESNPAAFPVPLPGGYVFARTAAALVWAAIAYALFSVLLTQTAGRVPGVRNGFFHNRGTPWPRLVTPSSR
jgi:hypothetical protein